MELCGRTDVSARAANAYSPCQPCSVRHGEFRGWRYCHASIGCFRQDEDELADSAESIHLVDGFHIPALFQQQLMHFPGPIGQVEGNAQRVLQRIIFFIQLHEGIVIAAVGLELYVLDVRAGRTFVDEVKLVGREVVDVQAVLPGDEVLVGIFPADDDA